MADVSKLARARLAKMPAAGPHPDADLLTAFAERSATPAEREQVLAHLATCAECREIVALAAPEMPVEAPAATVVPAKPQWLPWPVLRWGAVGAAVAVVAIAVIVQAPRYRQPAPLTATSPVAAEKAKADQQAAFASADKPRGTAATSATPAPQPKAEREANEAEAYTAARKNEKKPSPAEMDSVAALPASPPVMAQARPAEPKLQKPAAAPRPAGAVGAMVTSEQAKVDTPAQADVAASAPAVQPPTVSNQNVMMARSAPAAKSAPAREERGGNYAADGYYSGSAAGAGSGVSVNGQRDSAQDFRVRGIAYKWTVTSDGRVQRSTDGRTWFYVTVDPKARIRALASDGDEVWAGGDRGALYHSSDAGEDWKKVPLEHASGDIIRLIINGDTLIITTSSGQMITTSSQRGMGNTDSPKPASPR